MESTMLSGSMGRGGSLGRSSLGGNRGSIASVGKPSSSTLASLAGLLTSDKRERTEEQEEKDPVLQRVRVCIFSFVTN